MAVVEVFVDETKERGYLLCAAVVASRRLTESKKAMRELKPNNRDRLHMHDERPANRGRIVKEFMRVCPVDEAHIFIAPIAGRRERAVRDDCLAELARKSAALGANRILVESCSQDRQDFRVLTGSLSAIGALDQVRVEVDVPTSNEMLWAADLVVWAYAAGGRNRELVMPIVQVHNIG
ncbi:hypothetical protein Rhow_004601 [Rhodococcus wratislaviensis]|uniref:DUF3800 domain-containing protein n=1 Tax=Rhodococcus wratislaviensis TaxID=44752 RepID=A0A402CBI8_RHOWR|nr:hypothetical protein [Rhodococcus wratislaviensis]GCE40958.1 hypothetical protein Rhow_004601 [Rhodococcus wratislaviensis]